jgi:hypothetical protein
LSPTDADHPKQPITSGTVNNGRVVGVFVAAFVG